MYKSQNSDFIMFNKENFIGKKEGLLTDYYNVLKKLGKGAYGKVYEVKNRITGEIRACKQLSKSNINNLKRFEKEIEILIKLDHPNIIKLYEIFEDDRFLFLVMEKCNGGELFDTIIDHIQKKRMFTEKNAAIIFQQIISAISYCHNNGIVHRDLKPENILYTNEGDEINNEIKVIDFGLSRNFLVKKKMNTKAGTSYYIAPEVINGKYNEKCDVWSAAVILYILLSGSPPFTGNNDKEIFKKIISFNYDFPNSKWNNISKSAIDLIKKCLVDEKKRLTALQVLQHPWLKKYNKESDEICKDIHIDFLSFKNYINANKIKKMILTYIASRLNQKDVNRLNNIFLCFDKNKDGYISLNELKIGLEDLKNAEIDNEEIEKIFHQLDTDKNGKIGYTEFLASVIDEKIYLDEQKLYEAFVHLDKDNCGKINIEEIKSVLIKNNIDDEIIKKLIKKYDQNFDECINYNEFLDMMGYDRNKNE